MLDDVDVKIVSKLIRDGRTSLTELSEGENLSRVAIANRIEKLIDQEVLKISALVNLEKLNYQTFLVEMQVDNGKVQQFKKASANFPQIVHCFEVIGPYNFMLVCASKNNGEFKEFIENKLKKYSENPRVLIGSNCSFMHLKKLV